MHFCSSLHLQSQCACPERPPRCVARGCLPVEQAGLMGRSLAVGAAFRAQSCLGAATLHATLPAALMPPAALSAALLGTAGRACQLLRSGVAPCRIRHAAPAMHCARFSCMTCTARRCSGPDSVLERYCGTAGCTFAACCSPANSNPLKHLAPLQGVINYHCCDAPKTALNVGLVIAKVLPKPRNSVGRSGAPSKPPRPGSSSCRKTLLRP